MAVLKVKKRIMPGVVRRAYARKGVKAVIGSFRACSLDGHICGCALSVTFLSKKELEAAKDANKVGNLALTRAVDWGCTWNYANAFINGFDGNSCPLYGDEQLQGFADGQKTVQLIHKHNLVTG